MTIDTILIFLVVARWIHFAAVFVLYGSAVYWITMGETGGTGRDGMASARHATDVLIRWAAPIAALSGVAWLSGTIANMTGNLSDVIDGATLHLFFAETQFGFVSAVRLVLLGMAVVVAWAPPPDRLRPVVMAAIGAALLVSQAWLGHAAEGGTGLPGAIMIATYAVHVLAAGAWVGGLPPLLCTLVCQRRDGDTPAATLAILTRYSILASVAVGAILVSGTVTAGFRVGDDFGRLFATAYGDVLFIKVSVVAAMLTFAVANRFVIMPRLARAADPARAAFWMRRSVALEIALGVCVVGIAAVLGITPPPQ